MLQENIGAAIEAGRRAIQERRAKGPDPNSALIWFPAILAAELPVPRTEFVEFDPDSLYPVLDGNPPGEFPWDKLRDACRKIGQPCFLRTDLASAKHFGPQAFKLENEADLFHKVFDTFEDNCLKGISSFARAFMVREWISISPAFHAFGGLPIGTEWRFFATQDAVTCHHFYWPQKAFEKYSRCDREDWKERLASLSEEPDSFTLAQLEELALRAVRSVGHDAWSVDFAMDEHGKWWLIDMALADASWHPEECCVLGTNS
jgi:hypothetical protein